MLAEALFGSAQWRVLPDARLLLLHSRVEKLFSPLCDLVQRCHYNPKEETSALLDFGR